MDTSNPPVVSGALMSPIISDCKAVRGRTVIPGLTYACVVGAVVHSGPIPVKTDDNEDLSDLPQLEDDVDDQQVPEIPSVCFGRQLGWAIEDSIPSTDFDLLRDLYSQLAMVDDGISMMERIPFSERICLSDLYLERLRLTDKISFHTPPPPPRTVTGSDYDWENASVHALSEVIATNEVICKRIRQAAKNRRKRFNRRLRNQMKRTAQETENYVLHMFAEQQSGRSNPLPNISRNILALRAKGFTNNEITDLMRSRSFDRFVLSDKQLNRLYRDILQVRSAVLKAHEARAQLDHRLEKANIQRARAIERCTKYAENQALGTFIRVGSSVAVGISALIASRAAVKTHNCVTGAIADFTKALVKMLRSAVQKFDSFGVIAKAALSAAVVYFLFKQFEHKLIRLAILAVIPIVFKGHIKNLLSDFFSWVSKESDDPQVVEAQSGFTTDVALPTLIATVVLGSIGLGDKRGLQEGMVDAVGKVPRTVTGIEMVLDFVIAAVEKCINVLFRWIGRPEVRFRNRLAKEVEAQIQIADLLDKKMNSKDLKPRDHPIMFAKCSECWAKIGSLRAMHHENVKVRQALAPYYASMAAHIGTLRTCLGRGAGFRQEPLSVMIESNPGVGKTMNMPILIGTVLQEAGLVENVKPEELHQLYFSRPANSDFFDGYYGQECYIIDDIFARKPNPNGLTQFDEVMAFYGTTTCILNMADLPKKGNYPFTSSLLMMTTNLKNLDEAGVGAILIEPEAFKRRVDIHIHMEVLKEYQLAGKPGQLDFVKYNEAVLRLRNEGKRGIDAHPWYMWEAHDTYFGNTATFVEGQGRPFLDVVHEMISGLRQKTAFHENNMEHLANVFWRPPKDDDVFSSAQSVQVQTGSSKHSIRYSTATTSSSSDGNVVTDSTEEGLNEILGVCEDIIQHIKTIEERCAELCPDIVPDENLPPLPYLGDAYSPDSRPDRPKYDQHFFDPKKIEARYQTKLTDPDNKVVKAIGHALGFLFGLAVGRLIIKPLVDSLVSFIKSFARESNLETQSNGPKPSKNIIKMPMVQAADFSLWEKPYDSSYKMMVDVGGDSYAPFGQIIFLTGNMAVMPHHFLDQIADMKNKGEINNTSKLLFKPANGLVSVESTVQALLSYPCISFPEDDLHFVHFKKGFRMHPDILKFVAKEEDLFLLGGRRVRLDTAAADEEGVMLPHCNRVTYTSESVKYETVKLRTNTRSYSRYFSYGANTVPGDCGAPLCITDYRGFSNRLFCGLHVAGMTAQSRGYATPITQEICQKAVQHFKPHALEYKEATIEESLLPDNITLQCIDQLPFGHEGRFGNAIPLYQSSQPVSAPVKSSLVKTFMGIDEVFKDDIAKMNDGREPPTLVPMKMGRYVDKETGELVYPMEEALRPYVHGVFLPIDNSFSLGLNAGLKPFADATVDYYAPVLTPEQSVLGVPSLGLKSITRSTSVGFPLCVFAKNKKFFFGDDDDMRVDTPEAIELFDKVKKLEAILAEGKRPLFVCRDFLKDEVRKVGKKARLIAGTDLAYYILCRMYFGSFVAAVSRSHEKTGLCLGMNPYSEFGLLRRTLERPDPTGTNVWDGDFAGFDSSQMPQLLWECLYYINNWYSQRGGTKEENDIRTMLFLDLVYSRHITGFHGQADTILEWCKSLPSGHFLTAVINSMLSMGLIASGFVGLTGQLDFWKYCAAVVLGDDNVVSTSNEFVDRFNQVTLSRYLKVAFGMDYTAGRKGEDLVPVIGISKVVFLQRRWAVKDGHDVCPIRPESFLHSLYYVHSNDEVKNRNTLLAGIETALEELSMHDECYWAEVSDKLVRMKSKLGEAPCHSTLDSSTYLNVVRSRIPSYI